MCWSAAPMMQVAAAGTSLNGRLLSVGPFRGALGSGLGVDVPLAAARSLVFGIVSGGVVSCIPKLKQHFEQKAITLDHHELIQLISTK